jgi:Bacteriophage T4-like portal protein (Gp20)
MANRKIDEGYTEFSNVDNPAIGPVGLVGRFFSRFFSRGKFQGPEAVDQDQIKDPISNKAVKPRQPLHGDAVVSRDVIKASTILRDSNPNPILPPTEHDRKRRYREFEDMDSYPEIGSAFDIYADDCSQENLDGSKWDIVTDDEIMKEEVSQLFDTIELDRYLWDIVRNTVKFGDNFLELVVDTEDIKKGIQRIKILNPGFIYRVEDEFGYLDKFFQEIPQSNEWTTHGNIGAALDYTKIIPLDPGQIVHFRLHTSDPTHYPYGKSIASAARAIYKSLKLMEDAMLIYRLSRAPERRIFYIDTGALPTSKAEMHIKSQMDKFKKSKMYDRASGNITEGYNALAPDEDFYIAVNGKSSGTKIETLPGADNLGEVDDVKYFRDKLLAALKIPKDYIVEKDQAPDRKANLSQLDVKFARVVNRIQKSVEIGLESIAHRHLMIKGFPLQRIKKLRVKLPAPSDMARKRQLDLDLQKSQVVNAVKQLNIFPVEKLYKDYFQLNDSQIEEIKSTLKKEQKDPVMQAMSMGGMGAPGAVPGGPPGMAGAAGPNGVEGQESEENIPPTQNENVNLSDLESLLIENNFSKELIDVVRSIRLRN